MVIPANTSHSTISTMSMSPWDTHRRYSDLGNACPAQAKPHAPPRPAPPPPPPPPPHPQPQPPGAAAPPRGRPQPPPCDYDDDEHDYQPRLSDYPTRSHSNLETDVADAAQFHHQPYNQYHQQYDFPPFDPSLDAPWLFDADRAHAPPPFDPAAPHPWLFGPPPPAAPSAPLDDQAPEHPPYPPGAESPPGRPEPLGGGGGGGGGGGDTGGRCRLAQAIPCYHRRYGAGNPAGAPGSGGPGADGPGAPSAPYASSPAPPPPSRPSPPPSPSSSPTAHKNDARRRRRRKKAPTPTGYPQPLGHGNGFPVVWRGRFLHAHPTTYHVHASPNRRFRLHDIADRDNQPLFRLFPTPLCLRETKSLVDLRQPRLRAPPVLRAHTIVFTTRASVVINDDRGHPVLLLQRTSIVHSKRVIRGYIGGAKGADAADSRGTSSTATSSSTGSGGSGSHGRKPHLVVREEERGKTFVFNDARANEIAHMQRYRLPAQQAGAHRKYAYKLQISAGYDCALFIMVAVLMLDIWDD